MIDLLDMHTHTVASGHAYNTVYEMAKSAADKGLHLLGIADHGPKMPGSAHTIYFSNFKMLPRNIHGVRMMFGCELNILDYAGTVDLPEHILQRQDYTVASIHGLCYENAGVVKNTDNVIACMRDPKVRFISHPDSDRYPMDYRALVEGAKTYSVALEVNNSSLRFPQHRPNCLENYRVMIPLCMEYGVPIVVNSDAHDPHAVGNFATAESFLSTLEINDDLILNNDIDKLKAFLLGEKSTQN